jgi:hypothetical protein
MRARWVTAKHLTKYQKGNNGYTNIGKDFHYVFAPEDKMVFPRMWDMNNDQSHADYYADFLGVGAQKMEPMILKKMKAVMRCGQIFQTTFLSLSTTRIILCTSGISCGIFRGRQNDLQGSDGTKPARWQLDHRHSFY